MREVGSCDDQVQGVAVRVRRTGDWLNKSKWLNKIDQTCGMRIAVDVDLDVEIACNDYLIVVCR